MTDDASKVGVDEEVSSIDAANAIVSYYTKWAAGAGLIPVPTVDGLAIIGVQLRMIAKLSESYGTAFSENAGKAAVTSLIGTVAPAGGIGGLASLAKGIPAVGPLVGITVVPAFAAAVTYALGRVFVKHFEAGGTLLSFDAESMKDHFAQEFAAAKGKASGPAKAAA